MTDGGVGVGGGWGVPPARDPLSTQILSFLHTNFLQCCCVKPWQPPYGVGAPLGEILDPSLIMAIANLTSLVYRVYMALTGHSNWPLGTGNSKLMNIDEKKNDTGHICALTICWRWFWQFTEKEDSKIDKYIHRYIETNNINDTNFIFCATVWLIFRTVGMLSYNFRLHGKSRNQTWCFSSNTQHTQPHRVKLLG